VARLDFAIISHVQIRSVIYRASVTILGQDRPTVCLNLHAYAPKKFQCSKRVAWEIDVRWFNIIEEFKYILLQHLKPSKVMGTINGVPAIANVAAIAIMLVAAIH
jgi:hypothetical protein